MAGPFLFGMPALRAMALRGGAYLSQLAQRLPAWLRPVRDRLDIFPVFIAAFVFGVAALSAGLIYGEAVRQIDQLVKQRLLNLAVLAAAQTDPRLHARFQTPQDETSRLYEKARRPLMDSLRANDDLIYIYTIRRCADKYCIVLDAELPRPGEHIVHSPVMTVYEAPTQTLKAALTSGRPAVEAAPYTDEFGSFLSAYAPLSTQGGEQVVVGVDMSLRQYKLKIAQIRDRLFAGLGGAALLSVAIGWGFAALRRNAERIRKKHRSLVANMPAAIIECRLTDGLEITFVNDYITTLAGYLPRVLTKGRKSLTGLVPEQEREALVTGIRKQLSVSDRFEAEFRLLPRAPEGEGGIFARPIWVRLSGVKTGEDRDGVAIIEGFMLNITLRKATEAKMIESERQFRSLADSTPNLLWITNTYGESVFFNKTWLDYSGRSLDEEIDDGWLANIHPDDKDVCLEKFINTLAEEQPFQCWFRLKRHDGEYRWMLAVCTPRFTASGKCDGYISAATDITDRKAFEAQLRETSDQLELFFHHAPAAIAVFDRDMRYIAVSEKWRRDYALGDQDLIGRSHYEVFPDISDAWKAQHQRCLAGEILSNPEDPFVRADGSTWWVEWELHPWRQDGEVRGMIMFTDLINERKHLKDELMAHRDHLQVLVDERTRQVEARGEQNHFLRTLIATANEAGSLEDAVSQSLAEICRFAGWSRGEATLYFDAAGEAGTGTVQTGDGPNGEEPDGEGACVATLPIHLGPDLVALFRFFAPGPFDADRDITAALTDAEPQLARIIDRFRQEKALMLAKEAAENSARSKSEFLSNMSHELRTPMHAILNYAAMGRKKLGGAETDTARLEKYLGNIETAGQRLLGLLNNLLDLAKLEAGRMVFHPAPADLATVAEQAAMELDSLLKAKSLSLSLTRGDAPLTGVFDRDKMMQVAVNLLSNAIKFSPEGATLHLDLRCTRLADRDSLRLSLRDEGPGIPADEVEHIFEAFIQSSSTKSGAGGTGLGLSICREIIAAHDGRIRARNAPEGGAEFILEIPSQTASALGAAA